MRVSALVSVIFVTLTVDANVPAASPTVAAKSEQTRPIVLAQKSKRTSERRARQLRDIPLPERPTDTAKPSAQPATKDVATPVPKSASEPEPPKPDEWSQDEITKALRDCIKALGPIAAEVDVTVPIKSGACGTAAPVLLRRIGLVNPVVLSPPATMNCSMVAALHRWVETQLQPKAKQLLGSEIVAFENVSAYSCRMRNGSSVNKLSEHALANAIDIGRFKTADRQLISVAQDWGPTERDIKAARAHRSNDDDTATKKPVPPVPVSKATQKASLVKSNGIPIPSRKPDPEPSSEKKDPVVDKADTTLRPATSTKARFLKTIHESACGIFGTVLGPEANEAHRDHFHFDLAYRRRRAFCE